MSSSCQTAMSKYTLIVVMNDGFNVSWPNANQTIRLGYIHGFRRLGVACCLAHRDTLSVVLMTATVLS